MKFLIIIVEIIFGVKKIKMFFFVDPSRLENIFLLLLRIHSFLPYNSPGAGAGAGAGAAGNRAAPKLWWTFKYIPKL